MRESFHSQILRPANITKASTLGQSGIWCPATSTSGCITTRNNCAKLINPKTMLATRNPRTCELMFVPPFPWFENILSSPNDGRSGTHCRSRGHRIRNNVVDFGLLRTTIQYQEASLKSSTNPGIDSSRKHDVRNVQRKGFS